MFYYLLDKSTFLKNDNLKGKQTSILIYGTIIYIILHFILSTLKNKNIIKYFWVIFAMDVTVILINTNMNSEVLFNKENIPSNIIKKKNTKKNVRFKEPLEEIKIIKEVEKVDEDNKKENKRVDKKRKSTPINDLINKPEIVNKNIQEIINEDEINSVLAEIQTEIQTENSDGSDIDLDSFEKDYFEN
jgi:hypothetical protein